MTLIHLVVPEFDLQQAGFLPLVHLKRHPQDSKDLWRPCSSYCVFSTEIPGSPKLSAAFSSFIKTEIPQAEVHFFNSFRC